MEKCNFCVQRVNNARIEAKKQDRPINPGDVITACAQSCPTQAISFGNLNDNLVRKIADRKGCDTSICCDRTEGRTVAVHTARWTELNTLPRSHQLPGPCGSKSRILRYI